MADPKLLGEFGVVSGGSAGSIMATDRSQESVAKSVPATGRLVAAQLTQVAGSNVRGQTLILAAICTGKAALANIKFVLFRGYVYTDFIPSGFGSLPVNNGDLLVLFSWNSAASSALALRAFIADEDGSTPSWVAAADPRTDGRTVRVTKVATNVGASGVVLAAVPTNASWRWIYGISIYSATVTVGTRNDTLRWRDASGNIFARHGAGGPAASQTSALNFGANLTTEATVSTQGTTQANEFPCPDRLLPAGYDLLAVDGASVDIADTASLESQVEEFITP
jgi:hypothetical protein